MRAIFKDNRIFIYDSFIHKESIKQITGRLWHPEEKAWSVPVGAESIETLDLLGCELSDELREMRQKRQKILFLKLLRRVVPGI